MQLHIFGGTKEQQSWCHNFSHYTLKRICGTRLYNLLEVDLTLVPDLATNDGCIGNCTWLDEAYRPREFEIEIDSWLKPRHLLTTLAHELVHVKQYAKTELKQLQTNDYVWQGNRVLKSVDSFTHLRLPWEIEARGMEEVLFLEWAEEHNISDDWTVLDLYEH